MAVLTAGAFNAETFSEDLFEESLPLLTEHWREIAHYGDIPLDPDFEVYAAIARAGQLRVFTVRTVEPTQELIGYAVFIVRPNPHYKGSVQAVQDVLFIRPSHRGGSMGYRFIRWCDQRLRAEGAQLSIHHVKSAHDFGPLLNRLGYELVDFIYCKRLDRGD